MNTTYVYEFVNETVEIEISEEWAAILREMDREEMLSDRRETRRHTSLEISNEYSGWLLDYRMDPLEILIRNETEREIELLPEGAIMMTLECGMRFLTDYLEGDTYFKIHREGHNLDRARNQFALVADMERKLPQMKEIVKKYN